MKFRCKPSTIQFIYNKLQVTTNNIDNLLYFHMSPPQIEIVTLTHHCMYLFMHMKQYLAVNKTTFH